MSAVVIIGGGLTGLVAAERLGEVGLGAVVLEKEKEPGGTCRSISRDGFVFDHTGHLLHVNRPEVETYLRGLGVWDGLEVHPRRAGVVVGGRMTPYPIQIHTHGLAPEVRRDCLLGFIHAWAEDAELEERSFRDWVLRRFGEGLARHFFFPYNQKLYRTAPEELSLDWVGRYVPKPPLEHVVDGALGLHRSAVGYNAVFRYPASGGIRTLPDSVAGRVADLRLEARVVAVSLAERWLELEDQSRIVFDSLVSTIPLPALLDLVVDDLPEEEARARRQLRWVRVLNVALGVEGPAPRTEHWLYFPDPELPFYRVGFPSNHGAVAPPGCHTVSIEVSLDPGPADMDTVASEAEEALVGAGLLDPVRVRVRQLTMIDPAYVVYDLARRHAVSVLRRFLSRSGVIISGRWAEWKYSAMEDAVLDGMTVARRLQRRRGRASARQV